jgi:uncharacterized protein (UPF0332 family)
VSVDHRKLQIAAEVRGGDEALREGEALLGIGLFNGAVSRFYYAAFHFAVAALLSQDIAPRSHRALGSLFSQHLVRSGTLPQSMAKALRRLQGFREAADYDRDFELDRAGAEEEADVARQFVDGVRQFLVTGGWLG